MDLDEGVPLPEDSKRAPRWLRLLRRRLPVLQWAPQYSRGAAVADLVAGVTLGLTLVPQSIAYAALADLPVQYGLYSSFIGTMLYVPLGTVKEVSIGPTSLMALLTLQTCHGLPIQCVVLLTLLSGCLVLAMGLLRLGFLVDLISPAVTSGFTSATAVIIAVAQLKGLLGLSFTAESVVDNVTHIARQLSDVRLGDTLLGVCCCAALLALRKLKDLPLSPKRRRVRRALWLVSIARNALVVCASATLAYCTRDAARTEHPLFKLSGLVAPGLPPLELPALSVPAGNGTEALPFTSMVQRLGAGVLLTPVVMVLANIAIAKAYTQGGRVDATQEMLTLGLCNVAGSLVRAMPACGAFTRSAVSHSSGVRTPLAGLYSGIITLLALIFMTQYFYFIPKACLSAVLICAVIFMIDVSTVRALWRESKPELAALALTFAVSVAVAVELALLCGALLGLARLLRALMRPKFPLLLHKYGAGGGAAVVGRAPLALLYVNAEHVAARALAAARRAHPRPLLLDCEQLALVDHAAKQVLARVTKKLKADGQRLVLFRASPEALRQLEGLQGVDTRALRARTACDALALTAPASAPAAAPAPACVETVALLDKGQSAA